MSIVGTVTELGRRSGRVVYSFGSACCWLPPASAWLPLRELRKF